MFRRWLTILAFRRSFIVAPRRPLPVLSLTSGSRSPPEKIKEQDAKIQEASATRPAADKQKPPTRSCRSTGRWPAASHVNRRIRAQAACRGYHQPRIAEALGGIGISRRACSQQCNVRPMGNSDVRDAVTTAAIGVVIAEAQRILDNSKTDPAARG
jgi:hypothetical protein